MYLPIPKILNKYISSYFIYFIEPFSIIKYNSYKNASISPGDLIIYIYLYLKLNDVIVGVNIICIILFAVSRRFKMQFAENRHIAVRRTETRRNNTRFNIL